MVFHHVPFWHVVIEAPWLIQAVTTNIVQGYLESKSALDLRYPYLTCSMDILKSTNVLDYFHIPRSISSHHLVTTLYILSFLPPKSTIFPFFASMGPFSYGYVQRKISQKEIRCQAYTYCCSTLPRHTVEFNIFFKNWLFGSVTTLHPSLWWTGANQGLSGSLNSLVQIPPSTLETHCHQSEAY